MNLAGGNAHLRIQCLCTLKAWAWQDGVPEDVQQLHEGRQRRLWHGCLRHRKRLGTDQACREAEQTPELIAQGSRLTGHTTS